MERKLVNFRLDPALIEAAKERAKAEGLSLTAFVQGSIKTRLAGGTSTGKAVEPSPQERPTSPARPAPPVSSRSENGRSAIPPPAFKQPEVRSDTAAPSKAAVIGDLQAQIDEMVKGPEYRGVPKSIARRHAAKELA